MQSCIDKSPENLIGKRKAAKRRHDLAAFLARATPKELENHAAHKERVAKKEARKWKRKNMTTEERAEFNRQRRLSKAGMRERDLSDEAEEGAPECIKCGFRTHRDWCPDCGRPAGLVS